MRNGNIITAEIQIRELSKNWQHQSAAIVTNIVFPLLYFFHGIFTHGIENNRLVAGCFIRKFGDVYF